MELITANSANRLAGITYSAHNGNGMPVSVANGWQPPAINGSPLPMAFLENTTGYMTGQITVANPSSVIELNSMRGLNPLSQYGSSHFSRVY